MSTDFSNWIPMKYALDIQIGPDTGDEGKGQVSINDRPFLLRQITHMIVPSASPWTVADNQDGLYRIDWSLYEQYRFFKGAKLLADAAFGSIRHGIWIPLDSPVEIEGNQTLNAAVMNERPRGSDWVVQIIFHGLQKQSKG